MARIGLSATGGNPAGLLTWLQRSAVAHRAGVVVAPELEEEGTAVSPDRSEESKAVAVALSAADADIQLDYVPSVASSLSSRRHRHGTSPHSSSSRSARKKGKWGKAAAFAGRAPV